MRGTRYTRYTGEEFDIEAADLVKALADHFLNSGFEHHFYRFSDWNEQTFDDLKDAIRNALEQPDLFDDQQSQQLQDRLARMSEQEMDQLVDKLAEKLIQEGYVTRDGEESDQNRPARIEITDKTVDFLGYKALKDLLSSLGKSSFGAHDTRDMATGIEASGAPKPYEFGDTLNLDASATLFSAIRRQGLGGRIELEYPDLHVNQSEYQSSCATVLMLDCSHSMILYGEDRFTPAKKVALALAQLIRTQYPGDTLRCVLFHDSAEEVRLPELARVHVGPYHTNTRDGLILAQRLLKQERKDMKQIIMITDGKPTALSLDDGRIYKNSFGLDPLVISRTMEQVSRCKRQGILVNTFMLASDPDLVGFVRKVTEICRGRAYFASPQRLGRYLLMDYVSRKTRTVR